MTACFFSPQLLESAVAAAPVSVVLVPYRVFPVVVLVVLLGRVELARRGDLGENRSLEGFGLFQLLLRLFRYPPLLFPVVEDGGTILGPLVAKLPVFIGRVGIAPVDIGADRL